MVKILNSLLAGGTKRVKLRYKAVFASCSASVRTVDLQLKVGFGCCCSEKRGTDGKENRAEKKEPERGLKIGLPEEAEERVV